MHQNAPDYPTESFNAQAPAELYQRLWVKYAHEKLPQELVKSFANRVKREIFAQAFLPDRWRSSPREAVERVFQYAEENGIFTPVISGREELENAQLIFQNHQGPHRSKKKAAKEDPNAPKVGMGGFETLASWALTPEDTRIVMRANLVSSPSSLKEWILARALGKSNPLFVHTKNPGEKTMEERRDPIEAAKLKLERERIADNIFEIIESGESPVLLYPEGTRSPDGAILPFVSTFFRRAISDYFTPRIRDGREINIGAIISETLQVLPNGIGTQVQMLQRTLTMKGMRYDHEWLVDRMVAMRANLEFTSQEINELGRLFLMDVRRMFVQELQKIQMQSL